MSRVPRAICFDYGGTLVRIATPERELLSTGAELAPELERLGSGWRGSAGELALAFSSGLDRAIAEAHGRHPLREVDVAPLERRLLTELLQGEPPPGFSGRLTRAVQRAWISGVSPDPSALAVLASLRSRGLRLGLLSNAPYRAPQMRRQMDQLGLLQLFEVTLFSSQLGWRKPAPQAFRGLLRRLRLAAEEVWFVGDEWEADVAGASAVGIWALAAPGAPPRPGGRRLASWAQLLDELEPGEGGRSGDGGGAS